MNLIIFSKNRPAQLELLLRSMKKFWKEWDEGINVLFKEDPEYREGYTKTMQEHNDVCYWPERAFKEDVLRLIGDKELTAFTCDDDVFIRPFSLKEPQVKRFQKDKSIMCVSLRMGQSYDYCADSDRYMTIPKFDNDTWEWQGQPLDWGYPMSVLFNIFRTLELKPLLERLDFINPNTLEGNMAVNPLSNPKMIGFKEAKTINVPLNLVQTVCKNKSASFDPKKLNDKFLSGKRIKLEQFLNRDYNSCFYYPDKLEWE